MKTGIAVVIIIIAIVGTGGGIYYYTSCSEQKEDIERKTSTIVGSVEGLLGLIDNSLIQEIERYNSQCGWLTGVFNLGIEGEPAVPIEVAAEKQFLESYYSLVDATTGVTENYHKEIGKWESNQYDDRKLVTITDSVLSQYDLLVERASGFKPPQKYQDALDLYIKSLRSERASYTAFRDFVETGDPILNETSIDLLSNATKYELESFTLVNSTRNDGSSN